jgi:membrane protein
MLLKGAAVEFIEDKAPKQAAALAYYALFALGPLLLISVSVAGLAFGQDAVRERIVGQVGRLVGESGGEALADIMEGREGAGQRSGVLGALLGTAALLFGAAGVFGQLRDSLNTVWEVEARKAEGFLGKLWLFLRQKLLGVVGVLGTGFLLLVGLLASAAVAALSEHASGILPGADWLWLVAQGLVLLGLATLVFAAMFRFLPAVKVAWRDVMVGAFATSILFVVGELAIGAYLGTAATASRYGAAGAVVVLLLWVYYSGLILFFGAELTQVYANNFGERVRPGRHGKPLVDAVLERQGPPPTEGTPGAPSGPSSAAGSGPRARTAQEAPGRAAKR